MSGYSKLDCGMLNSSVWQEPHDVRVAWVTMLLLTDYHGQVRAAIPALAMHNAVSISRMEEIIQIFMSPDPYSRTKDYDGRRLIEIDGGWQVINYPKYRDGLKSPDRTNAERQARYKANKKVTVGNGKVTVGNVHSDSDSDSDSSVITTLLTASHPCETISSCACSIAIIMIAPLTASPPSPI